MRDAILLRLLEEQDDLLAPFRTIVGETRAKIAALLGSPLEELTPAQFRESLMARSGFADYARLVHQFPLLRARSFTSLLLHHFIATSGAVSDRHLGYRQIAPLARAIEAIGREPEPARVSALTHAWRSRDPETHAVVIFTALLQLAKAMAPLCDGAGFDTLGERVVVLSASMDLNGLMLGRQARAFQKDPALLDQWLRLIQDELHPILEQTPRPLGALEMFSADFIAATARLTREHPQLVRAVVADARVVAQRAGLRIAGTFLEHAPLAARLGLWPEYREISVLASEHPSIVVTRWLHRAPNLMRHGSTTGTLARLWGELARLLGARRTEGRGTLAANALLTLPNRGAVPAFDRLASWWRSAEQLREDVHPFAASQYLRHVARVERRFGASVVATWERWGRELSEGCGAEVAAIYFASTPHLLELAAPPDLQWFSRLIDACVVDRRNIDWMRSDLWLRAARRRHLRLSERWELVTDRLRARYPEGPDPRSYRLAGLSARELPRHIALWERFAELGYQSFLTQSYQRDIPVECVTGDDARGLADRLRDALAMRIASEGANRGAAHPLLARLDEDALHADFQAAARDLGKLSPSSFEQIEELGLKVRPGDLIELARRAPGEIPDATWLLDTFRSAVRRRRGRYPALHRLFGEIESLPTDTHSYEGVRLLANQTHDLLQILPGSDTGSCTDGPRGSKREFGIVHAMQSSGFKVLMCRPHPQRGWAAPRAFASVPGFRVSGPRGDYLFVDSIELGGEVHKLRDGFGVLARALAGLLAEMARDHGLEVALFTGLRNAGGQQLLAAYRRVVAHEEAVIDITLDARSLRRASIRRFYSEAIDRVYSPGLRDTRHPHPLRGLPVLLQRLL